MSQDPTAETETWQVAIAPNNVQAMTLEQLDAAYQAGTITEQTLVWTDGMEEWAPLSEIAGDDDEAEQAEAPAAVAEPTQPVQQAPVAQPQVAAQAPAGPQFAAPVANAQQPQAWAPGTAPVAQSFPPAGVSAGPPVAPQPPGISQAPAAFGSIPAAGMPSSPVSTAPVAMNLDGLDLADDASFGKRKSKLPWIAAAAVVLAGGGITLANMGGGGAEENAGAPAAAAAAAPVEDGAYIPPQKADPNAPLELGKAGYEVSAAEKKAFEKEAEQEKEMREKMEQALAGQKEEAESKTPAKVQKANWKPKKKKKESGSASAVKSGGSAYDPLNASLP